MLIVVFGIAFVGKARGLAEFADSVREMRVLPAGLAGPAALAVLLAEGVVCGVLLLPFAWTSLVGFALAGLLLGAFAVGILISLGKGTRTPCRCFGASTTPLGGRHVMRNLVLTGICTAGIAASPAGSPEFGAGTLLGGFCGLLIGVAVTALDDLVSLLRPLGDPLRRT
jgi:hypothetical protein